MTYRNDLDALTARQATLQAELGRKQRELDEVSGMLAEVRRVEERGRGLEHTPDLRRRHRLQLMVGALVVTLGSSAAMAAAAATVPDTRRPTAELVERMVAKVQRAHAAHERAQRLRAELEALQVLHLIPVIAPTARAGTSTEYYPRVGWTLGSRLQVRGSLWKTPASAPAEDQR